MNDITKVIIQLKNQFDIKNIEDYQSLLLIIYNSLFIYEDELTSDLKYILFSLLDNIIDQITQQNKNNFLTNKNLYSSLVFDKINEIYMKDKNKYEN